MNEKQLNILLIFLVAFCVYSFLFRWQRAALIYWRHLRYIENIYIPSHMLLVPSWQVWAAWLVRITKWISWILLWFVFPWYIPLLFIVLEIILIGIHSTTIRPQEHRDYFERKIAELTTKHRDRFPI